MSCLCPIRTGTAEHYRSDSAALQCLLRTAAYQRFDVTSCGPLGVGPRCGMSPVCGRKWGCREERHGSSASEVGTDDGTTTTSTTTKICTYQHRCKTDLYLTTAMQDRSVLTTSATRQICTYHQRNKTDLYLPTALQDRFALTNRTAG